jgi:hypothetical protein
MFGAALVVSIVLLMVAVRRVLKAGRSFEPSKSRYHSHPDMERLKKCVQEHLNQLRRLPASEAAALSPHQVETVQVDGHTISISVRSRSLDGGSIHVSVSARQNRRFRRQLKWRDGFTLTPGRKA